MSEMWNIKVFEEPGILMVEQTIPKEDSPNEEAALMMKVGLDQGRRLLSLIRSTDNSSPPYIWPEYPVVDEPFEELPDKVTVLLREHNEFDAVVMMDGAIRGEHQDDFEVQLLAASVFEHVGFFEMAMRCLEKALPACCEETRIAAVKLRLARARRKSGVHHQHSELIDEALACADLPEVMRVEGLLLRSLDQPPEEALETLDELLDLAEEHLGEHRLAANALELQADIYADMDEASKAQKFYLAAGRMLLKLQDPYFFSLNERLIVHQIRTKAYKEALGLSEEMFKILQDVKAPAIAHVPFFVFAARAHREIGDSETAETALAEARKIDEREAKRVDDLLEVALSKAPRAKTAAT